MENYKVWECLVCGWVYDEAKGSPEDGIEPGTRWEQVPDDWLCPDCGVGKQDFEMVIVATSAPAEALPTEQETSAQAQAAEAARPVVIIGSGLAGYNLAKEIRKLDNALPVVLITADDGSFYYKPQLSTAFHKGKSPAELVTATADEMARQLNIEVLPFTKVIAIDREQRLVVAGSRSIPYGKLVLATGAAAVEVPLPAKSIGSIYQINDLTDYRHFHAAIKGARKVLIIGAGLIGCEYANDLTLADYEVDVVDPMPGLLSGLLPATAALSVQAAMEAAGAHFHFNTTVKKLSPAYGGGVLARLANGQLLEADIVLSAIGLRPRVELAAAAGLATRRGICVDRTLQTSDADIFALGDCAEVDGQLRLYVAPLMACARALAHTLTGEPTVVRYGAMPVAIKTTLYPVVTSPPEQQVIGEWVIEQSTPTGVKAVFRKTDGEIAGFALTGECTKEQDFLARVSPPLMT
ncbi:FAD-dependent oxidoreductase [Microbulbifer sp. SA54]|uniref:FAD-dependent oxidoreductase n=1 Tax=Microbulbifer sp. SA54 TaxID=3401577 RepID=UPI003AADD137